MNLMFINLMYELRFDSDRMKIDLYTSIFYLIISLKYSFKVFCLLPRTTNSHAGLERFIALYFIEESANWSEQVKPVESDQITDLKYFRLNSFVN